MSRYFVTGAGGFVGRHWIRYLLSRESDAEILALDRQFPDGEEPSCRRETFDLSDRPRLQTVLDDFRPDRVVHLAAASSVAESWRDPAGCIVNNLSGLLHLLEALRSDKRKNQARILIVGSSEVYGIPKDSPIPETAPLEPENPYAIGRVTQEQIVRMNVRYNDMDIVQTRSFSHTGPGQSTRFVVPSFLRRLVDAWNRGEQETVLVTGNVDLIRDFTDVRDVVRAYRLLLESGQKGEVYNVCRGVGIPLREVIRQAAEFLGLRTTIEIDPLKLRPGDPVSVVGDPRKIFRQTGWKAEIPFDQTLRDMIESLRSMAADH